MALKHLAHNGRKQPDAQATSVQIDEFTGVCDSE